jgi:hypothetical protein
MGRRQMNKGMKLLLGFTADAASLIIEVLQ